MWCICTSNVLTQEMKCCLLLFITDKSVSRIYSSITSVYGHWCELTRQDIFFFLLSSVYKYYHMPSLRVHASKRCKWVFLLFWLYYTVEDTQEHVDSAALQHHLALLKVFSYILLLGALRKFSSLTQRLYVCSQTNWMDCELVQRGNVIGRQLPAEWKIIFNFQMIMIPVLLNLERRG